MKVNFTKYLRVGIALCAMTHGLFAQGLLSDDAYDCTEPTEIVINSAGLSLISTGEYESEDGEDSPVIFYKASDKYTFWYKFIVQEACSFSFDIFPSSQSDIYNFFLYKHPGGSFCKGIIDRSILPIRANLYKKAISTSGTGLKRGNTEPGLTEQMSMREVLYNQSYHPTVEANAGDIYYLNVYHTLGDDCGHRIKVTSCSQSLELMATHKPCYIPPVAIKREENLHLINPMPTVEIEVEESEAEIEILESAIMEASIVPGAEYAPSKEEVGAQLSEMTELKISVIEGASKSGIDTDVKVIDKETGHTVRYHIDAGEALIPIVVDKSKDYKIAFTSLGYINHTLELAAKSDYTEVLSVELDNVKAGANLVLKDLLFHPNTYALRDESQDELENLLSFMKTNERAVIKLLGYTSGDYHIKKSKRYAHLGPKWNYWGTSKKLSKLRAAEIRDYLTKHGIEEERMEIQGMGGQNMIVPHPLTNKESMVNMRVEMLIVDI